MSIANKVLCVSSPCLARDTVALTAVSPQRGHGMPCPYKSHFWIN